MQKIEIGARLKEERERLGLSQVQFAGLGEASKRAQITYENGESTPNAAYLAAIAKVGADVQYIITGVRSVAALAEEEEKLLRLFRAAPLVVKATTLAGLEAGGAMQAGATQTFNAPVSGGVAARDIVNKGGKRSE